MAGLVTSQIANMALSHVGDKRSITTLDDDSPQARILDLWFDVARKEILEQFDWSFARKRAALTDSGYALNNTEGWSFAYDLPADCIAPRMLEKPLYYLVGDSIDQYYNHYTHESDPLPYTLETDDVGQVRLLTNYDAVRLIYTYNQTNMGTFTMAAGVALSYLLAARACYSLTGKKGLDKSLYEEYLRWVVKAQNEDWGRSQHGPPREAEAIRARQ